MENCDYFHHDGFKLAFRQAGEDLGNPVLLIHGFASSMRTNWLTSGWFATLGRAGHRVIALDNRGHGLSGKSHKPAAYTPELMAGDAAALLDYLDVPKAHIFGYSMGARIAAFFALQTPKKAQSLVLGGLGAGMVTATVDWPGVRKALLAPDMAAVHDVRGMMFRKFAERTKSDLKSLAACAVTSKKEMTVAQVKKIKQPVLVAVGSKDDIAGAPQPLAALLPHGRALEIPGRDHMLAVGDKSFKQAAVDFFAEHAF